jgi:Cdc6-like AAA superfamily ATPase
MLHLACIGSQTTADSIFQRILQMLGCVPVGTPCLEQLQHHLSDLRRKDLILILDEADSIQHMPMEEQVQLAQGLRELKQFETRGRYGAAGRQHTLHRLYMAGISNCLQEESGLPAGWNRLPSTPAQQDSCLFYCSLQRSKRLAA